MEINKEQCEEYIFVQEEADYGPLYKEHLLKQYHQFVESVEWIGTLKQRINSYFLTINTIFFATIGVSFVDFGDIHILFGALAQDVINFIVPAIGTVVSILWWLILHSYRQRSIIKLHIVRCLEDRLPVAPYTTEETIIAEHYPGIRYYFFKMTLVIPWIFVALYLLLLFLL